MRKSLSMVLLGGGLVAAPAYAQSSQQDLPPLPAPTGTPPPQVYLAPPVGTEGASSAPPTPPPTGKPTDATAPPPGQDPAKKMRASFRVDGGFQYAKVEDVPITGARVRLGMGGQNDFHGHYGTISFLYGSTENDLRTWDVRFGWTGDLLRYSILRAGIDAEAGYFFIHRASTNGRLWALGAGVGIHASADVIAFGPRDDNALMIEARFDAHLHFGGAVMWGPSLLVGLRF